MIRDFLSDIDFAELSLQLTEIVELTHVPNNYTVPGSPSPATDKQFQIPHTSPIANQGSMTSSIPSSPRPNTLDMAIPTDIRISGLLCLKHFVFVKFIHYLYIIYIYYHITICIVYILANTNSF